QVAAEAWTDESKAARRPIAKALDLTATASNATILSATRNASANGEAGALRGPADETTRAELELARKLHAAASRLEDLEKHGIELRKQAVSERRNMAEDKANRAKLDKKDE